MLGLPPIWVVDTSSLIRARDLVQGQVDQRFVFAQLDGLVHRNELVYPIQVLRELEQHIDAETDPPYAWAKRNQALAARRSVTMLDIRRVLALAQVIDPDKVGGVEEADPYVLTLADVLKAEGHQVTVITDDFRDRLPVKLSLSTGCGLLGIPSVPIQPFLAQQRIWPRPHR